MKNCVLPVVIAIVATNAGASCGSAFCSANTNWDTQGLSSAEGLRLDLRYSYAKADRLSSGSSRIAPEGPSGSDEEIENMRTINQVLNLDADYAINSIWNISLGVPLLMRDHAHTFDSSIGGPFLQEARFTELGDIRVIGRYRLDAADQHFRGRGIRIGLKLPTGAIDKTMTPQDPTGDPTDPSLPHPLDRASQPGSGSTDLILGAYCFDRVPGRDWGWFFSGQVQAAILTRDNFRPGTELNFDLGAHYGLTPTLTALLQLNAQLRERDSGSKANPASGGYSLNLSPGLSYALTPETQLYGLLQIALKQYANSDPTITGSGQLTAPWSLALGISRRY